MRRLLLAVVAIIGCGLLLRADPPAVEKKGAKKEEPLRIKVFRLTQRDPEAVREVLNTLLQPPLPFGGGLGGLGGGLGIGGGGGEGGAPGGGVPANLGGALGLGGMGGLGGFGGGGLGTHRIAIDNRTKSLIVRGTEKDLRIATDLVTVLNTPADKALPKVKNLSAFKLRHANPEELSETLGELELKVRIAAVPDSKLLIVAGSADEITDITEVIEALDVAGKPEDKKPEKKPEEKKPEKPKQE